MDKNNYISPTTNMLSPAKKPIADTAKSNPVIESVRVLLQYAKARWLIFNFAWATLVALMIAYDGIPDPLIAVLAVSASYLILLATYTYNDAQDLKVDKVNDPKRPLASGRVSKEHVVRLTYILNAIALILASLINIPVLIVASILVLLGILYSHPKTSFKDRFPYKTVVTSIGALLASFLGGFAGEHITLEVIYAGVAFFIFCTVLALLGDVSDLKGDKASGRRTLPIIIGKNNTALVIESIIASMVAISILLMQVISMSIIELSLIVGVCIVSMLIIARLFIIEDTKKIKRLRPPMRLLAFTLQLVLLVAVYL